MIRFIASAFKDFEFIFISNVKYCVWLFHDECLAHRKKSPMTSLPHIFCLSSNSDYKSDYWSARIHGQLKQEIFRSAVNNNRNKIKYSYFLQINIYFFIVSSKAKSLFIRIYSDESLHLNGLYLCWWGFIDYLRYKTHWFNLHFLLPSPIPQLTKWKGTIKLSWT